MDLAELKSYKPAILAIADKHCIENIRIFGSVARGDATSSSDIDFLVHLKPGASLFELGGLHYDLQALLGCHVDVVPDDADIFYPHILQDTVPL